MGEFHPTVGNVEDAKLPFGKHKGEPLKKVPVRYLNWLLEQTNVNPALRQKIEDYLENPSQESLSARFDPPTINVQCEAVTIMPLPRGNRIEVKLKRKISKAELEHFRKIVKFIEEFITEEDE